MRSGAGAGEGEGRSILGLQRARLLGAGVGVLAERGYAGFTAAGVCARAGISRRTFYELFENREQCFAAILTDAEQHARSVVADLGLEGLAWPERMRMGLWALLCLADEDPGLARVCLVESQRAGAGVQRQRERILAELVEAIDRGRLQSGAGAAASRLTAEALVGALISVVAARLAQSAAAGDRDEVGVRGLLGELAGMIVLPYLGAAAARRQLGQPLPDAPSPTLVERDAVDLDPLAGLSMRLTYRTAQALQAVAWLTADGVGASNRQVAERAGISDLGQASKLLSRLAQNGLLENTATDSQARGQANQWWLTQAGRQVLQSISTHAQGSKHRSAA